MCGVNIQIEDKLQGEDSGAPYFFKMYRKWE